MSTPTRRAVSRAGFRVVFMGDLSRGVGNHTPYGCLVERYHTLYVSSTGMIRMARRAETGGAMAREPSEAAAASREPLTRERAVRVGLELADAGGIESLSM